MNRNENVKPVKLKQFTYVSHQVHDFSVDDLRGLMVQSRRKNKELELTGLLLFDHPLFLQVLEGPEDSIDRIANDILADSRHRDMDIIHRNNNLREREFSRWRMGCKILGDGLPDDYRELDSRIKQLLIEAKPNGDVAHQLLLEFGKMKDSFIDI